jgi:hypothetical protein
MPSAAGRRRYARRKIDDLVLLNLANDALSKQAKNGASIDARAAA